MTVLRDGGYDPAAITMRMLLDHTAGVYDYTAADAFYATIDADPSRRWTRASARVQATRTTATPDSHETVINGAIR